MPFINFTNIITVLLAVILFGLIIFLGMELMLIPNISEEVYHAIARSIAVDFGFIFLSFVSYLWVDDIQAKIEKRKSIDDSLNWFWAKV